MYARCSCKRSIMNPYRLIIKVTYWVFQLSYGFLQHRRAGSGRRSIRSAQSARTQALTQHL